VNTRGEIVFGFLSGYGYQEGSFKGQRKPSEASFIRFDPTLGDLIRGGAEIENTIRDLKYESGLNHLPSELFGANAAWLAFTVMAHNLARWVSRIGLRETLISTKKLRGRHTEPRPLRATFCQLIGGSEDTSRDTVRLKALAGGRGEGSAWWGSQVEWAPLCESI